MILKRQQNGCKTIILHTVENKNGNTYSFTPAYNRAHTLPRTYESLQKQSCKDFVWLIVDDGSKDQTAKLVKEWQQQEKRLKSDISIKKMAGCIRRIM